MHPQLTPSSVLRRFIVILFSAIACAFVGYYLYLLIWKGEYMPDLGLSFPWFPWKGELRELNPVVYALLLFAVWVNLERAAANHDPGYGILWLLDFVPSAALFSFLVLTLFRLFMGEIRFTDPAHVFIYATFAMSSMLVAAQNWRHWFKTHRADDDILLTHTEVVEALREVMGTHSVTLHPRPGFSINPDLAYVRNDQVVTPLRRPATV